MASRARTVWRGLAPAGPPDNAHGATGHGGTPSDPDSIDIGCALGPHERALQSTGKLSIGSRVRLASAYRRRLLHVAGCSHAYVIALGGPATVLQIIEHIDGHWTSVQVRIDGGRVEWFAPGDLRTISQKTL